MNNYQNQKFKKLKLNQFHNFDPVLFYSYKMYPRNLEYDYNKTRFYLYFYLDPFKCYLDDEELRYINLSFDKIYFAYEPFYVGKGTNRVGYRMNQHINDFLKNKDKGNRLKNKRFEEMQTKLKENGQTLLDYKKNYIIIYKTFKDEKELIEAEMEVINTIGNLWDRTGPLTNKITKYEQEKFNRRQKDEFY